MCETHWEGGGAMLVQCEIAGDGFFDTCRVKTGGQHGTGTDTVTGTGTSLGDSLAPPLKCCALHSFIPALHGMMFALRVRANTRACLEH